jgi:hypothetical protein
VDKNADEILDLANKMYDALQSNAPAPSAPSPPAPEPHVTAPSDIDPNLMYSNPAEYHRQLRASLRADIQSEISSASGAIVTPLASLAKAEAKRNPKRKAVWDRYAPEIEAMVARLPEQARARPDIWDEAAKMVAGEHVDEIARTEADRIIAAGRDSGTLPTQHGSPNEPVPSGGSPLEKLFREEHASVKGFLQDGIPISKVREHARKQGYTEEGYAKLLTDRTSWRVRA